MLPLPEFEYLAPTSLHEALRYLEAYPEARLVAGGTDLLPNMKHGLLEPPQLIGLTGLRDLDYIRVDADGGVRIGALTRLASIRDSATVQERLQALAQAAGQIAGPQLQNMGTLGGNLCLDTRCVYINQSHFWREALGYCLKKDGTVCHVVAGGKRCVAANSSDTAPVMIALGAELVLSSPRGERVIPVGALYKTPGDDHLTIARDEILSEVRIPALPEGAHTGYSKLRVRKSIDFPIFSCALMLAQDADGNCTHLGFAANALGSQPRDLSRLAKHIVGHPITPERIDTLAQAARKRCVPLHNINVDPEWRRAMVPVVVKRLFSQLLDA